MKPFVNTDQIIELAAPHGINVWPIELNDDGIAFYLDRDIANTSLYTLGRVTIPSKSGKIEAYCGLYNAQGNKISSDKLVGYETLEVTLKAINQRFERLKAPFCAKQPQRHPQKSKRKYNS